MGCLPSMDTAMGAGTRTSAEGNAYEVLHVEKSVIILEFDYMYTSVRSPEPLMLPIGSLQLDLRTLARLVWYR